MGFTLFGVKVGIRVNDPGVLEQVAGVLPPHAEPTDATVFDMLFSLWVAPPPERPGIRHYHLLYQGPGRLARTQDLKEALRALQERLHAWFSQWSPEHIFIHAGVVARQGRALLIPGRTCTGKTTLVADLVRAGCEYFSDEYAVIDNDGLIHPYARPLGVRDATFASIPTPVECMGGRPGSGPIRAAMVLATRYEPGTVWSPRALTPGQTLLRLTENAVAARKRSAEVLEALTHVVRDVSGFQGPRGESRETAIRLIELLDRLGAPAGVAC